jgi:DNA-binding MarR family transcriptional regulator
MWLWFSMIHSLFSSMINSQDSKTVSVFSPKDQQNINRKIAVGFDRISQVYKSLVWQESKTRGLSPIQIQFLTFLLFSQDEPITIGFLASYFALTSATVSDAVTALEAKGLVARERKQQDKRTVFVSLTKQGKAVAKKISGWANLVEGKVADLPNDQKAIVLDALLRLAKAFQDEGVVSRTRMCLSCRFFSENPNTEDGKDKSEMNYCSLFDRSLTKADLRIDCPEHQTPGA